MAKQGVSNNTIATGMVAVLVVLTLTSVLVVLSPGTITGLTYGQLNVTVPAVTTISTVGIFFNASFFGMAPGVQNDTDDGSPQPIQIQNDGNVLVKILVEPLWQNSCVFTKHCTLDASNTTDSVNDYAVSVKCAAGEAACGADSMLEWVFYPGKGNTTGYVIRNLPFADATNMIKLGINVSVPAGEPAGAKNITMVLTSAAE